jgi:2-(1,2-epoxy-1,2-dihydrophenyl)acetyl-CoA isomerase
MRDDVGGMVSVSATDGVVTITLDRAERHNSLVPELLSELGDAFRAIDASLPGPVVLRASGPSFSTGGDLAGFLEHADDVETYSDHLVGQLNEAVIAMIDCPVPVVAAVDGQVTGGSLGLVLATDIVLVTERASFQPFYVDVGFSPDGGWATLLPEIIGQKRAMAVQLLNQRISAELALEWGLAAAYTDSTNLEEAIADLCGQLRQKNPGSVRETRRLLRPRDLELRLDSERMRFVERISAPDALENVRRFLARGK